MILGRLVLILFFSLQLISWPIRAEDRAEDLDQNFNLTVFPAARMESKYSYPTPSQTQTLDQIRARFVDQIKLAQASWYPSLLDSQIPSEFERQVVETSMKRTPIWLCKGRQCEGCPNDHSYSCVLGRKILNSVGAAILLHPCHLSNSGCGLTSMSLEQVIEKELSVLAFYKLKKVPKYVTAVAGYRSATSTLQHASAVFQDLLRACPGSLPLTGFNYLLNFRHLVEITSLGCIERILTPLRNLPHSCRSLESSEGFRKRFKNGLFRAERKGYRCDSLCQVMTCGKESRTFLESSSLESER